MALPRGSTVDDCVEDALLAIGCVAPTNYRSPGLKRLDYSRSSRTDKGVSSLATHVSARLVLDSTQWGAPAEELAPEALQAASSAFVARLNTALPPAVRCFHAVPVPRSFEARHACCARAYSYLLPLRVLVAPATERAPDALTAPPPRGPPVAADAPGVAAALAALDAALRRFEGTHSFHNFTKRRLYAPLRRWGAFRAAQRAEREASEGEEEEEEEEGGEEAAMSAVEAAAAAAAAPPDCIGVFQPGGTYWLAQALAEDRVGSAHVRRVHACRVVGAPEVCPTTGEPFVRLAIEGESFMVHQIRKMVATALAQARGALPATFLDAALARPCRTRTPMAPAATLLLRSAAFYASVRSETGVAGQQVLLRTPPAVSAATAAWSREVLQPRALAPALVDPLWEEFLSNLSGMCPEPEELGPVLEAAAEFEARPPPPPRVWEPRPDLRAQARRRY